MKKIVHIAVPGSVKYRLIFESLIQQGFCRGLLYLTRQRTAILAQEYHQRWEVENTLDEFKTHLNGRKTPIRSKYPRGVVQEIYGWLLGHWAVRSLMFQAAQEQGLSPLRLGFTGTLRVVRRAMAQFQQSTPEEIPLF